MKYFLWINGKEEGPFDKPKIVEMLRGSTITRYTPCRPEHRDEAKDWEWVGVVPGLQAMLNSAPPQPDSAVRCPKCQSTQVTAIQKGFGTGGAVLGAVLLGPVGLLGGLIGSGKPKLACMKCGHTFQPGE